VIDGKIAKLRETPKVRCTQYSSDDYTTVKTNETRTIRSERCTSVHQRPETRWRSGKQAFLKEWSCSVERLFI